MTRSLRVLGVGVIAAALALSACSNGSSDSSSSATPKSTPSLTGDPIIWGLNEDSSGPGASYSTVAGKTIRDAVDEINETGGLLGRPVKLVVGNDESDPTKSPSVVRKLIDDGAQALFTVTATSAINQSKPIIQEAKIPTLAAIAVSQAAVAQPNADYVYAFANLTNDWTKVYCGAFKEAGVSKLAILSDSTPTIDGLNKLMLPNLEACITVVAQEKAPVDATDVSAQVAKLKSSGADVVLVSSVGGPFEVLVQNTLSQQFPGVLRFSLASIGNQAAVWKTAAPGSLNGLVFMGSLDNTNPRTKELDAKLKERRGADFVLSAYDAQAYQGVQVLKMATEKAGSTDPEKVKAEIEKLSGIEGYFGQSDFTLSFTPDKHLGSDGLCGLVLTEFGPDNTPKGPWAKYQAKC